MSNSGHPQSSVDVVPAQLPLNPATTVAAETQTASASLPAPVTVPGEGCPTPLAWQQVLEEYREHATPWVIQRDGIEISGRTWGEGRRLIFVNHLAGAAELYSLLAYLLREEYQTIVYDVRGDGRSRRRTMHDYSDDLWKIADLHQAEVFDVYGASFGAAVALQAAIDRPSRIRHLILQQGCARRKLSFFERSLAAWVSFSRKTFAEWHLARRIQIANNRPWFPSLDPSRGQFLMHATGSLKLADLAHRARVLGRFDVRQRLGELQSPLMLIYTEGEGKRAEQAQRELERLHGRALSEWLHSTGQHPYLTHPHRIAKLIRSFASDPPPANT